MRQEIVKELLSDALKENETLFLIELSFLAENKILIEVDGDNGVTLKECMRISRYINDNLDREEEDYGLEVTSPDIANPLKVKRQYKKNKGKTLQIKTTANENYEGVLTDANENQVFLEWKVREPKPVGKGKVTVVKTAIIEYKNIQEAKVKIIFN